MVTRVALLNALLDMSYVPGFYSIVSTRLRTVVALQYHAERAIRMVAAKRLLPPGPANAVMQLL